MIIFTKVYNHKKRFRKDGTAHIYIRAYYNAQTLHFNTGVRIKPEAWAKKLSRVYNHPNATRFNKRINTLLHKLENYAFDYEQKYKKVCPLENLKNVIQDKNGSHQKESFLEFIEYWLEHDYKNDNIRYNTYKCKRTVLRKLKQFRPFIPFDTINYKLIKEFDLWLNSKSLDLSKNTISKSHSVFRAMINQAIKFDHIQDNPYKKFKIKRTKPKRIVLTPTEVLQLEQAKLTQSQARIRDIFVFSAYTSLRFGDVVKLKNKDLKQTDKGHYLCYTAEKTNKYIELPIDALFDGKPLAIFLERMSTNPDAYVFGNLSNQYANREIHKICKQIGLKKNVTMHAARHTFATYMASKVPTPVLQAIMQHSDIRTTMIYVQMSNNMIRDSIQSISWD